MSSPAGIRLDGRAAAVMGDGSGLAGVVAARLIEAGARATVVAPQDEPGLELPHGTDVAVWADPIGSVPVVAATVSEDRWDRLAEAPVRRFLWFLQSVQRQLQSTRDGRVVLVCPPLGMEGEAGFVPHAAAAEGQRLLALSAARQWRGGHVAVNVVVGGEPDGDAVADTVVLLAAPESRALHGVTLGAGGALLVP